MTRARAVKVFGPPAPKGSMKCVGQNGKHQLVDTLKTTKPWRQRIHKAAKHLTIDGQPWSGPVGITLTFTIERPASVPLKKRAWPHVHGTGDTDKLARTVLDGLEDCGVLSNDAQVCVLSSVKCYPDTPDVIDQMDQPGVVIRIFNLEGTET